MVHPYKYAGENVEFQGLNVFKVCKILVWWLCKNWLSFMPKVLKNKWESGSFKETALCSYCQEIFCVSSGSYIRMFQNLLLLCNDYLLGGPSCLLSGPSCELWLNFFFNLFQGRVSVADIIAFVGSETISSKTDGQYIHFPVALKSENA